MRMPLCCTGTAESEDVAAAGWSYRGERGPGAGGAAGGRGGDGRAGGGRADGNANRPRIPRTEALNSCHRLAAAW
ncbi:hypothetical protein GBAR_LOCUS17501 [Geodia barretti]|uniref:Uncharacterized protein n=1 Tax=Geodia barretti TaxID=519541 RepID=A0AA35WS84_GEOBA|nr:hypothetical protein GBAR_LOCUS17501 [Geodia barretti]